MFSACRQDADMENKEISNKIDSIRDLSASNYALWQAKQVKNSINTSELTKQQLADFFHYSAVLEAKLGKFDSAVYFLDRYLKYSEVPNDFYYYEEKVTAPLLLDTLFAKAKAIYYIDKGEFFRSLELYDLAIEEFKKAERLHCNEYSNFLYINFCQAYLGNKQTDSATIYLKKIITSKNDIIFIYYNLIKADTTDKKDSLLIFLQNALDSTHQKFYLEKFEIYNRFAKYYIKQNMNDSAKKYLDSTREYLKLMRKNLNIFLPENKKLYETYIEYYLNIDQRDSVNYYLDSLATYNIFCKNIIQKTLKKYNDLTTEKEKIENKRKIFYVIVLVTLLLLMLIYFILLQNTKYKQEERKNSVNKLLKQIPQEQSLFALQEAIIQIIRSNSLFPDYDIISLLEIDKIQRRIHIKRELSIYKDKSNDAYIDYTYSFDDKNSLAVACYNLGITIFSNNIQKEYKKWISTLKDGKRKLVSGKLSKPVNSVIYLPIVYKTDIISILTIQSLKKHTFSDTDLLVAESISNEISDRYSNIKTLKFAQMYELILNNRRDHLLNRIIPLQIVASPYHKIKLEVEKFIKDLKKLEAKPNLSNLNDTIAVKILTSEIIKHYETLIKENNLTINNLTAGQIITNAYFFKTVINELIVNAIKHNTDCSIIIKDDFSTVRSIKYYELTIRDNGRGLPQWVIDKLGKPVENKGSGLMIVYSFVEKFLNGTVDYQKNAPNGTIFSIKIPQ